MAYGGASKSSKIFMSDVKLPPFCRLEILNFKTMQGYSVEAAQA